MFVQLRFVDLTVRQRRLLVEALSSYNNLYYQSLSAGESMDLLFMANSIADYNFKFTNNISVMSDSNIRDAYDVFVWLTKNYSSLPVGFRNRFPEKSLVTLRQALFNSLLP